MIDDELGINTDKVSWEDAIYWGFIAGFGGALLHVVVLSIWN